MNRKSISVFFTALLCTTFGHEYLGAKQQYLSRHHERSLSIRNPRTNQEQCDFLCPVPSPSPEVEHMTEVLSLVYIEKTGFFAVLNILESAAIVFEIGGPLALVLNGKTGVAVSINIEKQTVVYYPAGSNENLWNVSQAKPLEYLQTLGTHIKTWENGQSFKLNKETKEVKNAVASVVKHLSFELAVRLKINPDAVISLVSVLIRGLSESSDVVSMLLTRLQSSLTFIYGGLTKFVNLAVGLKAIGKKLDGGVKSLVDNSTNVSILLGENSGYKSLINLLFQLGNHVDLTKVLGGILQSPEEFLCLAVQLDGGIYVGIPGLIAVIHNVQLYAAKKISLEALIDILIQVEAANKVLKITKEHWIYHLDGYFLVASQASQYNSESSWTNMNKFFMDLKEDKLVISGINVSAMINTLISTSGNASLSNLVKLLLHLKPAVSLSKLLATLYFRMICFVVSGQGLLFINGILPDDISITINFSSSTSIIKQLLAKVNYIEVGSYLLRLDIVGAITHLPVLGPIYKALENSIKAVGAATEVTMASALKAASSILKDLKNLILFGLGHGGNVGPADLGIAGVSALGGGVAVTTTTTWVSSVEWSSSHKIPSGGNKESNGFSWSLF